MFKLKNLRNNRFGLGGTLGVLLGFATLGSGLTLPVYGDGVTNPTDCGDITRSENPTVPGVDPVAGRADTGGTDSSFAAGCDANAETSGSVAIGDEAAVESYDVTTVVEAVPGVPTDTYYSDSETDSQGIPLSNATGTLVEVDTMDGNLLHVVMNGVRTGVTITRTSDDTSALIRFTGPGSVGSTTTTVKGSSGVAIGNKARVVGENSVAIGAGATVEKLITIVAEPGVPTDTYYNDSETDSQGIPLSNATGTLVEVDTMDGNLLHVVMNGVRTGVTITRTSDDTSALIRFTGPGSAGSTMSEPAENAVALGANSAVTGDNGVALGASANADANGIAIGGPAVDADGNLVLDDDGNITGVTAGANQIVIGSSAHTSVEIGGIDLNALDRRATTNASNITTNTGNIARNSDDIETNRAGIASAIALASLPVLPGGSGNWGIALGSFDSETAVAVGANWNVSDSSNIKVGISSSSGETSAGIGFGMRF